MKNQLVTQARIGTFPYAARATFVAFAASFVATTWARADLIFTVSGTVSVAAAGWNVGDSISLTWRTAPAPTFYKTSSAWVEWWQDFNTEPDVYKEVSGTSMGGLFNHSAARPNDYLRAIKSPSAETPTYKVIEFILDPSGGSTGLTSPNGSPINWVKNSVTAASFGFPDFTTLSGSETPDQFFSPLVGTYSVTAYDSNFVEAGGNMMFFNPSTLEIASQSAVPEIDSAGMGSVLALVTGALGLVERRRVKAA